jgi:1-acyl-sn-glycerol-3-phosphate acyltransferase
VSWLRYLRALWRLPMVAVVTAGCILLRPLYNSASVNLLWVTACSAICGYRVEVSGSADSAAHLVVGNHVGFLDVLVVGHVWPAASVVTKSSVRWIPLVGLLWRASAIFVDRSSVESRRRCLQAMEDRWRAGETVFVFPEGTVSYSGVPFHPGSFRAAERRGVSIQGVRIDYPAEVVSEMRGRYMHRRFFWVICTPMVIRATIFPSRLADREACSYWQETILGHGRAS